MDEFSTMEAYVHPRSVLHTESFPHGVYTWIEFSAMEVCIQGVYYMDRVFRHGGINQGVYYIEISAM
jgi:hypothetical protein